MSSPATPDTGPITDGEVTGDLMCVECEYNLRTLAITATCPECGMKVVVSARGDRLAAAPMHWRHSLNWGAWWLRWGVVLALPLVYPGVLMSSLGVWFLTRAQPDRDEPALDRGYRLAGRWLVVLGGAAIVCLAFGALIALMASSRQRIFEGWRYHDLPIFDLLFLLGHAVWVLGMLATWRYLRVLAQRVPDTPLAKSFSRLALSWIIAVALIAGVSGAAFGLNQWGLLPGAADSPPITIAITLTFMITLIALWVATLRTVTGQATILRDVSVTTAETLEGLTPIADC